MEGEWEQECYFGFHPQLLCRLDRQRKAAKKLPCLVASAGHQLRPSAETAFSSASWSLFLSLSCVFFTK